MEELKKVSCKNCRYCTFEEYKGNPNRYYCIHPVACKEHLCGAVKLCVCDRNSNELKIKKTPKWCPLIRD